MRVDGTGGVLVVDKPAGPTSHDVVARVRRALGIRRVGHCGTLDPLATGVLVLCVGPMTRFSRWLTGGDKEYDACFRLGATSDTDDALGRIDEAEAVEPPALGEIEDVLEHFRGGIEQVPPEHSAVRVRGVRSYHRARRRQPTGLAARPVRIDRIEVVSYEPPLLRVHVQCGKGTYIRSLARDLGQALGCGGLVEQLRRLRVGTMTTGDAIAWTALEGQEREGTASRRTPGPAGDPGFRRRRPGRRRGLRPRALRAGGGAPGGTGGLSPSGLSRRGARRRRGPSPAEKGGGGAVPRGSRGVAMARP